MRGQCLPSVYPHVMLTPRPSLFSAESTPISIIPRTRKQGRPGFRASGPLGVSFVPVSVTIFQVIDQPKQAVRGVSYLSISSFLISISHFLVPGLTTPLSRADPAHNHFLKPQKCPPARATKPRSQPAFSSQKQGGAPSLPLCL